VHFHGALLAASLVAVCLAAGCGGDDEGDAYAEGYTPLNDRLLSLGVDIGDAIENAENQSDSELARQFRDLSGEVEDVQEDLEELEPPEDLSETHEDLVEAVADAQDALDDIARAATASDPEAARTAARQLILVSEDVRESRRMLARETGAKVRAD
jgi:hypothetical protein